MTDEGKSRAALLTEVSLLLAVLFFGTNPVAVRVAVAEVPPLPFVALRFTVAGLLGLVALLMPGGRLGRRDLLDGWRGGPDEPDARRKHLHRRLFLIHPGRVTAVRRITLAYKREQSP